MLHRKRVPLWLIAATIAILLGSATVAVAATQTYNGDQLQIIVTDTGRPAILVKPSTADAPSDPYIRQYFSDDNWGSVVWLYSAESTASYGAGYQDTSFDFTPVSNQTVIVPGGTQIVTVVELGSSGVQLTQRFTHLTGDRFVTKEWTLTNNGATTFTGARHYHGGDSYFGGEDDAFGFYDSSNGMVYLRNNLFNNWGLMGFFADPSTPADHYFEGEYDVGDGYAEGDDGLPDTVDPSFQDAGYYLQWDRGSFAPGASWTTKATELWTAAGALQIFAPGPQNVVADEVVALPFTLQNLTETTQTLTLTAASSPTWTTAIVGGAAEVLSPNEISVRTVNVTVPSDVLGTAVVTLSATGTDDLENSIEASASTRLNGPVVVTYTAGTGGSIDGSRTQVIPYGGNATEVTATPDAGYHFVRWSNLSTTNPRTDSDVTANLNLVATFALSKPAAPYSVTFGPVSGGTLIQWAGSPGATGYQVYAGGRLLGTTGPSAFSLFVAEILGPKTVITVVALSDSGPSDPGVGIYRAVGAVKLGTVRFGGNSSRLTPSTKRSLKRYARIVAAQGFTSLKVSGYTAKTDHGSRAFRKRLSVKRAKNVKAYLAAEFRRLHVSVGITTAGYGGSEPVSSNKTRGGMARNRRAEVILK